MKIICKALATMCFVIICSAAWGQTQYYTDQTKYLESQMTATSYTATTTTQPYEMKITFNPKTGIFSTMGFSSSCDSIGNCTEEIKTSSVTMMISYSFKNYKIIDMRLFANGMSYSIANYYNSSNNTLVFFMEGEPDNPMEFRFNPDRREFEFGPFWPSPDGEFCLRLDPFRMFCLPPPPDVCPRYSPPCVSHSCGDGWRDAGEECDDGNLDDNDDCRNDCTVPVCGDGRLDTGEECDDGNLDDNDECRNDCTTPPPPPECGNGRLEIGEECDDGNRIGDDGCNNECLDPCPEDNRVVECSALWTKHVSVTDTPYPRIRMSMDSSNNIYVVSTFFPLDRPEDYDTYVYVAKFDACGNRRWERTIGAGNGLPDRGIGIVADGVGNAWIIAHEDPFLFSVRKYDTCGIEQWIQYSWVEAPWSADITKDDFGNIYVSSAGLRHGYLVVFKYSASDGAPAGGLWPIHRDRHVTRSSIVTDTIGDIYIATEDFGRISIGKTHPTGEADVVFNESPPLDGGFGYDPHMTIRNNSLYMAAWLIESTLLKGFDGADGHLLGAPFPIVKGNFRSSALAVDSEGNMYLVGLDLAVNRGMIVKYNPLGEILWADTIDVAPVPWDPGRFAGLTIGHDGYIYVVGPDPDPGDSRVLILLRKYTPDGFSDDGPPDFVGP